MSLQTRNVLVDRNVALFILVPVALSIFFSVGRFLHESLQIPADEDYRAIASILEKSDFQKEADKLVILPPWSLRPLVVLKDYPWISGDQIGDRPLYRYSRLFVLLEADGEDEFRKLRARFQSMESLGKAGGLELFLMTIDGGTLAADLTKELKNATIFLRKDNGEQTECSRRLKNGFQCNGRQNWQRVTEEYLLVSENGQKVIWTHPPRRGEVLHVRYENVDLGDQLVFRSGHTRKGARAKAPVDVEVLINGKRLASFSKEPAFKFSAKVLPTASSGEEKATVEFRFKTNNDSRNHFAFDAYTYHAGDAQ